jgi:hypothetical protein
MGEDQNKSDEERFEENLRQILDGGPSYGGQMSAGRQAAPSKWARSESEAPDPAEVAKAEAEPKALFWFKLIRPLAFAALLLLLTKFVLRIMTAGG